MNTVQPMQLGSVAATDSLPGPDSRRFGTLEAPSEAERSFQALPFVGASVDTLEHRDFPAAVPVVCRSARMGMGKAASAAGSPHRMLLAPVASELSNSVDKATPFVEPVAGMVGRTLPPQP